MFSWGLTPELTGAGGRRPQGTNTGHENGEAMASVGVRVEPPVMPGELCEKFAKFTNHALPRWMLGL
jgi:hypothetical protein